MQLILVKGWDGTEELISDQANDGIINEMINSLDWQQLNSITLMVDESNWLSVSGNISDDGLAVVCQENGNIRVSDIAPENVEELIIILQSYLKGGQQFKKFIFSADANRDLKLKEIELKRFQFDAQKKTDKWNRAIFVLISTVFVALVLIILYLWYIGELKLIAN